MSSPTRPQIREALRTLVADKRYRDHSHPEHDAYVAHVTGEFKRVYPGIYVPGSSHMYANDPEGGPEAIVEVRAYSQSRDGSTVQVSEHTRSRERAGPASTRRSSIWRHGTRFAPCWPKNRPGCGQALPERQRQRPSRA